MVVGVDRTREERSAIRLSSVPTVQILGIELQRLTFAQSKFLPHYKKLSIL